MDTSGYVALTRQAGLLKELQVVANNVANISTNGFRREEVIFTEMIESGGRGDESVSMTAARGRFTDPLQGGLERTGGTFDLAIEGDGYFLIETAAGTRLTRAGTFIRNAEGELVTLDGNRLLDAGEAPVFVPPNASSVAVAADGTVSADGAPVAQIGLVQVEDQTTLFREGSVLYRAEGGFGTAEGATIAQGFLESSNVNAVFEISRMIEVQRAYELGQKFIEREDERIRAVVRTLGQRG